MQHHGCIGDVSPLWWDLFRCETSHTCCLHRAACKIGPDSPPVLQVPLELYKKSMVGMRKHLVVDIFDGIEDMSFVSETRGDVGTKRIDPPNMRFEHLTCFIGGTLVLGELPIVSGIRSSRFHSP